MFNKYTAQATTGITGSFSMWNGLDLANLKTECGLGETPIVDKEVNRSKKKYLVSDLMSSDEGLKYDLILNIMLDDKVITMDSKVQIGFNGGLKEVYVCKEKSAYRIWRKTYYGKKRSSDSYGDDNE
tara:strand:- start:1324 stop:1704 length:381 start_codon:yes stop_codon:yes gene_type:complete